MPFQCFSPRFSSFVCNPSLAIAIAKSFVTSPAPPHLFATMATSQGGQAYHSFGPYKIGSEEVFLTTKHSFAFLSARPVLPDVIIASKRVVPRFVDLNEEETTDLVLLTKRIGAKIEPHYGATSLTFSIQDGINAGQSVPHVHVHLLPRKIGDFEVLDQVYDELDRKEVELKQKLDLDDAGKSDEIISDVLKLREIF